MARIYLLTVHPESDSRARGGYISLRENARLDRFKVHQLVDNPASADLILFAEIDVGRLCEDVLRHPLVRRFRDKCFLFSTDWRVVPFLPGIYTALERRDFLPRRVRAGFYPSCLINPQVQFEPNAPRDLLYSFIGDVNTHPVRRALAGLDHPPGAWVDTSAESQAVMWRGAPEQREQFWARYVALMRRSDFVLCPRGLAPSSIRMFEAMAMGRAPVVIADAWVPPEGPRWESFLLRVPEGEVATLPDVLRTRQPEARELGLQARREWEAHFAPDLVFHRVIEQCLELQRARTLPDWIERLAVIPQMLRPHNLKELRRAWMKRLGLTRAPRS
jgi:hypothetical protein